ncbi:hypothetical protein [Kushneria marisflavi]|uniref:Uncharacterized protein n=1 Tax=Kushneria marisflavi TaxID=157779 RepID=A0A240UK36_9GAMM|nr:hypothetical protein [Kushneria marisflavi]ART61867.1 hypothetical protein B9H00_01305 [Kushneria marisflavi]
MSFLLLMNEGRPTSWLLTELSLGNVARLLWAALLLVDQRIDGRHRALPVGRSYPLPAGLIQSEMHQLQVNRSLTLIRGPC